MKARSPELDLTPRATVLISPDAAHEGTWCTLPHNGRALTIGRAGELVLPDGRASRKHLSVRLEPDGAITITDEDSRNGTTVGGSGLQAPLTVWSDAIVQAGDSLIHIGHVLPKDGTALTDRLIGATARHLCEHEPPLRVWAAPGAGLRRLARQIHARRRTSGSLYILSSADILPLLSPDDTVMAPAAVLLDDNGELHRETAARVLIRMARPDEAQVVLPPLETRRMEVWRVSRMALDRHLGVIPTFSLRAAGLWLQHRWTNGWRSVHNATVALSEVLGVDTHIRTQHVVDALDITVPRTNAGPRPVPGESIDSETLETLLAELGSVAAVAEHCARSKRQVYRWMEDHGVMPPSRR